MNTETDIVKEMRWLLSAQTKETNGPHYYTVPRRKMNAILNEIERLRGAPPRPSTAEKTLKNTLESTAMCIDKQHTFEDGETQFARTWWFETEAARDAAALASPSTEGWSYDMDKAPKDGTPFLIARHGRESVTSYNVVYFDDNPGPEWPDHIWAFVDGGGTAYHRDWPTHWHPLLPPPAPEQEGHADRSPEPKASTS